jgi:hypothetical protein
MPVAKRERFEKKFLCVWCNYKGLVYYELVPGGHMINAEVYSTIRENVYGFARKVPSASEPKALVTSAR